MGIRDYYILTIFFFTVFQIHIIICQQCTAGTLRVDPDQTDRKLAYFTYLTLYNYQPNSCFEACMRRPRCQTFNYNKFTLTCELNVNKKDEAFVNWPVVFLDDPGNAFVDVEKHRKNIMKDLCIFDLKEPCKLGEICIRQMNNERKCVDDHLSCGGQIKIQDEDPYGKSDTASVADAMKEALPTDCDQINVKRGNGVYKIFPKDLPNGINVYCNMETDSENGGWTVIQRRFNNKTDFYREWADYETGFGNLEEEFWLGNQNIQTLTSQGSYELRVDLEDFDNSKAYASYTTFKLISRKYTLTAGGYSGTAGDSLDYHIGRKFSTKDNDSSGRHCAKQWKGAWWCHSFPYSNLNGMYLGNTIQATGMHWYDWKDNTQSLKATSMMIRRKK